MICIDRVSVKYGDAVVLDDVSLRVAPTTSVALTGPSGTGKTSLLDCLGGVRVPTTGNVVVDGVTVSALDDRERSRFRARRVGLMFQQPELLDELSVVENVALMQVFDKADRAVALSKARDVLDSIGLSAHADKRIDEISGGQAQRVSLARALAKPDISVLVADEPTASLDAVTSGVVTELLLSTCRERGITVVIATHDLAVAQQCDASVWLPDINGSAAGLAS